MSERRYTIAELIKKLGPFLRPYLKNYLAAVFLLVITSLLSLLPPYLLKVMIDNGIQEGNVSILNIMAISLIGVTTLSGITRWLMEYLHEWVSNWFIADLRGHLFAHVLRQPMSFFSSAKIGDILSRLRTDITAVYGVLVNTFLGSLSEVVQIVGTSIFLLYLNPTLALIALSFIPPLYLILVRFGRQMRELSMTVRRKDANILEFFHERMGNIQLVKLYNRGEYEDQNHVKLSEDVISSSLKSVRYKFVSTFFISLLTTAASILIVWYGGYRVINGSLSFGSLFAFYLYTSRLYGPLQSLANRGVEIYNGLASAERVVEYMDLKSEIVEATDPKRPAKMRGEIFFDNVSFQYPRNDSPVIQNLTLSIQAGWKVALVGPSGAGKTTIINLLGRLYDVDSGSISIDGNDVRELAFDSLYKAIGVIPQDSYLFNATVEENIRYGRVDASQEDVIEAAKKAHLHDFIQGLPNGYQTVIGPRGAKLSGGQRQRLAIARLVLKDPPIWILDEFTSSLDSRSEAVVYENIIPLLREKTALIIAHRLSTILSADVVAVVQNGGIMEIGTHAELYHQNGHYKRLFDNQFGFNGDLSIEGSIENLGKPALETDGSVLTSTGPRNN